MRLKVSVVALCVRFFLILFSLVPFCLAVDEGEARSAMKRAHDQMVKDCYLAVAAADKAGCMHAFSALGTRVG